MTDPTTLNRHEISRLTLTRNASFGITGVAVLFLTVYRGASGSWPFTGAGGEGDVSLAPSPAVLVVLAVILGIAAYLLRGNVRALLLVAATEAAFFGLLAFSERVGVGLVMQAVWLLVAVAVGCALVGIWAARVVWYARQPSRWYRRLDRIAERAAARAAADEEVVVQVVSPAPPKPRRAPAVVVEEVDLEGIDLTDDADADELPAGQQVR